MSVKGKSARGVIVDFDLLRIKEQMAAAPLSFDVQARQDFVENKMRRRARKKIPQELLDKANAEIAVDQTLPSVEDVPSKMIEDVVPAEPTEEVVEKPAAPAPAKTKQKARPKNKK